MVYGGGRHLVHDTREWRSLFAMGANERLDDGAVGDRKIGLRLNGAYPKTVYSPKAISVPSSFFDAAF
jgi:hypothetical protein